MKRQKSEHQRAQGGEYVKRQGVNVTGNITGMVEDADLAADRPDCVVMVFT